MRRVLSLNMSVAGLVIIVQQQTVVVDQPCAKPKMILGEEQMNFPEDPAIKATFHRDLWIYQFTEATDEITIENEQHTQQKNSQQQDSKTFLTSTLQPPGKKA